MESNLMTHIDADDVLAEQVAALFEQHYKAVFGYLYRLLDDVEGAHDLTQETFLRLYRTRERLQQIENERAWIYRIASNLAFNALKRRGRFAWLPWREGEGREGDVAQLRERGPAEHFPRQEQVARALAALSPTYRTPLLLFARYDFSVREVAQVLEISEAAVKTRLYRAREMFRAAYGEGER